MGDIERVVLTAMIRDFIFGCQSIAECIVAPFTYSCKIISTGAIAAKVWQVPGTYGAVKASRLRAQGRAGRLKSLPPAKPRRRSVHYIAQSPRLHNHLDRPKSLRSNACVLVRRVMS